MARLHDKSCTITALKPSHLNHSLTIVGGYSLLKLSFVCCVQTALVAIAPELLLSVASR
jgi:hypothetical protein